MSFVCFFSFGCSGETNKQRNNNNNNNNNNKNKQQKRQQQRQILLPNIKNKTTQLMTFMFSLSECCLSAFLKSTSFSFFRLFFLFFFFLFLFYCFPLSLSISIPSSASLTWKDTKVNIERKNEGKDNSMEEIKTGKWRKKQSMLVLLCCSFFGCCCPTNKNNKNTFLKNCPLEGLSIWSTSPF